MLLVTTVKAAVDRLLPTVHVYMFLIRSKRVNGGNFLSATNLPHFHASHLPHSHLMSRGLNSY